MRYTKAKRRRYCVTLMCYNERESLVITEYVETFSKQAAEDIARSQLVGYYRLVDVMTCELAR